MMAGGQENRNGMEETLRTGMAAAHGARGAIKTGKALAGMAKGAAAGGPYGAAAGALWEGRKHFGKIATSRAVYGHAPGAFV